ncbi:MAG: DNA-3-methyladenine glycosylase [Chitinophagales bacterium]|nr:DNA-3-methyladenine glycosylase [Bacteroidota bacterium]
MKLSKKYYLNEDVVYMAKDLLGKVLITNINGIKTGGIITETEAYSEIEKGSHAYNKRMTDRTQIMFGNGGYAYVYLCYGMYYLFNVVTGKQGTAQAVLIRSIKPTIGVEEILIRRNKTKIDKQLCNGPGKVCQALGITKQQYGISLMSDNVWIEKSNIIIKENQIQITPRIGIDYAEEDKNLPWRFVLSI